MGVPARRHASPFPFTCLSCVCHLRRRIRLTPQNPTAVTIRIKYQYVITASVLYGSGCADRAKRSHCWQRTQRPRRGFTLCGIPCSVRRVFDSRRSEGRSSRRNCGCRTPRSGWTAPLLSPARCQDVPAREQKGRIGLVALAGCSIFQLLIELPVPIDHPRSPADSIQTRTRGFGTRTLERWPYRRSSRSPDRCGAP